MMYDYLRKLKIEEGFDPSAILDIGAWNGFWTKQVMSIWPDASYTCIEAGPKHENNLKKITPNYHIAVLGDSNRSVKMYLREIDKGNKKKVTYTKGSSLFAVFDDYEVREMQTLDQVVGPDSTFDLIKQDVQGAEIMIMNGAPEIFKRAKYVIQEVNVNKDKNFPMVPDEKEMDLHMQTLGFGGCEVIADHGNLQVDKIYY